MTQWRSPTELPDGSVPPAYADANFIIGPGPTHGAAPEMTVRYAVPKGTLFTFSMSSADSRIYPGGTFGTVHAMDPATLLVPTSHPAPYMRRVTVSAPHQYVSGNAAPFIVGAHGPHQSLSIALDNLIAEKLVPRAHAGPAILALGWSSRAA